MTTANVLPRFEDCIEAYLAAYDRFGTDPFAPERLEPADRDLLELGVAYGLFAFDGTAYRVRCEPGSGAERWERAVGARVTRIQRAVSERARTAGDSDAAGDAGLTHGGDTFATAFVTADDDFDAVVDTVHAAAPEDHDGVVLRSPADLANDVQRFADRLCEERAAAETPLPGSFEKVASDVVGSDKDDLEFRLFLSGP